ncbi:MAG: hypothetical protein KKG99_07210 [Bacteroidetes bacterium]|nr:hypothetical protein [Bacteroidota bacterium]
MKKQALIICLLLVVASCTNQQQEVKSGPYLGEKQPGIDPVLFAPGTISTGLEETLCTFTPDGNEIIFGILYSKPHSPKLHCSLVRSYLTGGVWSFPEIMKLSEDKYSHMYPFISYDGGELYFQSDLPTNSPELKDKYNIWKCKRVGDHWSDPEPLPMPVNGRGDVSGPSMSANGEFYYTLMSGNPKLDGIYKSNFRDGTFSEPERLPESVNVKEGSFDGVISPDGTYYLVNVYGKEDSYGATDLYVSFKDENEIWTPLKNLGSTINTKLNEGSARISSDGKYIFFSAVLGNQDFYNDSPTYGDILNTRTKPHFGNYDIYWVSTKIIEGLNPENVK